MRCIHSSGRWLAASNCSISDSCMPSHRPSEHSRKTSPGSRATASARMLGGTWPSAPMAPASTLRLGRRRGSFSSYRPACSSCCTRLWSSVRRCMRPARNQYRRESPQCAHRARPCSGSMHSTTTVALMCMREAEVDCWPLTRCSAWEIREARLAGANSGFSRKPSSTAWTVSWAASSPCPCPPAPSARVQHRPPAPRSIRPMASSLLERLPLWDALATWML